MIKIKKKVSAKVSSGNFKNFDEVYIFGFGINGRTIFHIIKEKKLRVDGFLDTIEIFRIKNLILENIINPKKLKLKLEEGLNVLVIISHDLKTKDLVHIIKQLNKLGLNRENIRMLNVP